VKPRRIEPRPSPFEKVHDPAAGPTVAEREERRRDWQQQATDTS
jgi:hypothetical protein